MKIECKSNISRMPEKIAIKKLPYIVIKILNGANIIANYANKQDVICVQFNDEQEFLHIEDFTYAKQVADNIYNSWIKAKQIESSYQTLGNSLLLHEIAQNQLEKIYNKRFNKKSMNFIKGDDGGCGYWRMILPAQYLDESKYAIDVSTAQVVYQYLLEYDTIFVQRVHSWDSYYVLKKLKEAGKEIIYDIDDNIFDVPNYHPAKSLFGNDARESSAAIMELCDKIIVTTQELKDVLIFKVGANIIDKIEIIPNAINLEKYPHKEIYPIRNNGDSKPFRIMWAGSATHDYDFHACIEALDKFLLKHKEDEVRILLMGFVPRCIRERSELAHWQGKIEVVDFKDIETYFNMIDKVVADIAIAPLIHCPFNESKSNIKWQEYTLSATPTIASNFNPYANTIEHGKDGFLVDTPEEWLEILEDKFNSREDKKWQKIVDNARDKIDKNYNIV